MPSIASQRVPAREMVITRPELEAYGLLAYAFVLVAVSSTVGLLIKYHPMPLFPGTYFTHDLWYVVVFKLVGMLGIPLIGFYRSGYRFRDLQPKWRITPKTLAWTVAAFLVGFSINNVYIGSIRNNLASGIFPDAGLRLALGVVVPLISAGIPEEFYYRGLLQTRLEALWGRAAAILVSVLLFTAWHLPTRFLLADGVEGHAGNFASVALHTGLPVFIVGLIFAVLYDRYRSLIPLIALHWGIDTLPALASFLGIHR